MYRVQYTIPVTVRTFRHLRQRDLKVPLGNVDVFPDGVNGYSIYEVCGNSKLWGPDRILHWGLPRQLRRDAAALGLPDLPPAGPRTPAQETPQS